MLVGKPNGMLGSRWCSRWAVWHSPSNHCHGQGGWWRSQVMVDLISSRSPKQCALQQLVLAKTLPEHGEDVPRMVELLELQLLSDWFVEWRAHTLLICYLNVLSASRYLCAKPWLTLLWKACLTTTPMIDCSWVWALQWVLWAGQLTWFWSLSRPIPIWPRLSQLIKR